MITLAATQFACTDDRAENLDRAERIVREAAQQGGPALRGDGVHSLRRLRKGGAPHSTGQVGGHSQGFPGRSRHDRSGRIQAGGVK